MGTKKQPRAKPRAKRAPASRRASGARRASGTTPTRDPSDRARPDPGGAASAGAASAGAASAGAASAGAGARADELVQTLSSEGITCAKIGGFDIDGVLRGKYVSLDKFRSALKQGFGFCDVIFGWDVADALYDQSKLTGWHTGYPDAHAVLDQSTLRRIPFEPGVVAMLCDFRDGQGRPHPACPRSLLRQMVAKANRMGFEPRFSAEFEFFIFQETRDSLAAKQFQALKPLDPGMFGYSWLRTGQDAELMRDLWSACADSGIPLEGLHTETGPGVYEVAITYSDALTAADNAALFKTVLKQVAHRHGLSATFMAKWNTAFPGCGGHVHQSLWRNGKNAFADSTAKDGMSRVMKRYVAGQMALMQDFTALMSPTINSYKRYVPGLWAPLVASWGVENRTCALRIIGLGSDKATRIEHRQGAADINPYLAMAACLGAGLFGIEQRLNPPRATQGDPGESGPLRLPRSLQEATERLEKSDAARAVLGTDFVDHYVMTRKWEVRCYETAVTDWELKRYFESI